jgi:hypothetical protein
MSAVENVGTDEKGGAPAACWGYAPSQPAPSAAPKSKPIAADILMFMTDSPSSIRVFFTRWSRARSESREFTTHRPPVKSATSPGNVLRLCCCYNRIPVHPGYSVNAANPIAPDQKTNYGFSFSHWSVRAAPDAVMWLCHCASAFRAAKALVTLAVFSEAFTSGAAVETSYFDPCFLRATEPKCPGASCSVFGSYPMTFPVIGSNQLRGGILDLVGRGGNRTPGEQSAEGSRGTIPHTKEIHRPAFQSDVGCLAGLLFSMAW